MRDASDLRPPVEASRVRHRTYVVIFGHDTRAGRLFDVLLIVSIITSVLVIMLESVASVHAEYGGALRAAEWFFTLLFTVEYVTRLWCVSRPLTYTKKPPGPHRPACGASDLRLLARPWAAGPHRRANPARAQGLPHLEAGALRRGGPHSGPGTEGQPVQDHHLRFSRLLRSPSSSALSCT